jgi:hypothetical protein
MRMTLSRGLLIVARLAAAFATWWFAGAAGGTKDWRTASSAPVGLAPEPGETAEALVQVYAARAWGLRGLVGVHTWIAVKPTRGKAYTVYEVIGWRLRSSATAVSIRQRAPDARWYGAAPVLLAERRGHGTDALIERIDRAARAYPHAAEYAVWPGPNSNTFTAYLTRTVPELGVDLPPTAVGKDYLGDRFVAKAPSGRGFQLSLYGLLGVLVSVPEGIEVNLLGLTFGVDPLAPAIKLPLVGRLGAGGRSAFLR